MSDSLRPPWTVACQAPLSMGFPRSEYWSGLPFTSPGNLHNPGIKPIGCQLHWQVDSSLLSHQRSFHDQIPVTTLGAETLGRFPGS